MLLSTGTCRVAITDLHFREVLTVLSARPCYVCGVSENRVVAAEPMEHRYGKPVLPDATYRFVRCSRCSTMYVDCEVSDEHLTDLYVSETVEGVPEIAGGLSLDQLVVDRLPEFEAHWAVLKQHRPVAAGDELLDFGCQTGEFGSVAQRDGVRPSGIELSPSYAGAARNLWGDGSVVHSGPIDGAPFAQDQFAYITAFETLEHMCDPIGTLRALRPWLRADGLLALSVPSTDYFHFKYWLLKESPVRGAGRRVAGRRSSSHEFRALPHTHIYNFSHTSVRLLAERAGFEPISVGVTGWHGPNRRIMTPLSRAIERFSKGRIGMAPSLFLVASR